MQCDVTARIPIALAVVSVSAIAAVGVVVSLPVWPTGDDCTAPVRVSAEMMQLVA